MSEEQYTPLTAAKLAGIQAELNKWSVAPTQMWVTGDFAEKIEKEVERREAEKLEDSAFYSKERMRKLGEALAEHIGVEMKVPGVMELAVLIQQENPKAPIIQILSEANKERERLQFQAFGEITVKRRIKELEADYGINDPLMAAMRTDVELIVKAAFARFTAQDVKTAEQLQTCVNEASDEYLERVAQLYLDFFQTKPELPELPTVKYDSKKMEVTWHIRLSPMAMAIRMALGV